MNIKSRKRSNELAKLELLNTRMKLTNKDMQHFLNLKKGYEGEKNFDSITNQIQSECFILNDLLFEVNNTIFQLDTLIISQGKIYFYEVKNYDGDFFYESNKLYKKPKFEIVNPFDQLSRSESLLTQLLMSHRINLPIASYVVFINPNFTLYQAPLDKPIIFSNQINRHFNNLSSSNLNEKHKKLADKLLELHLIESPYNQTPSYNYNQLKKGIICSTCRSFFISILKRKCICKSCGQTESIPKAVLRSVEEYKVLFPNNKITTNIIHDWCQIVNSKERISKILKDNYKIVGVHQWAYYE